MFSRLRNVRRKITRVKRDLSFLFQNVENLSPQIIRRVAKEMAELIAQPPEGIRVILNEADVTDIQAVIEGPCMKSRALFARSCCSLKSIA